MVCVIITYAYFYRVQKMYRILKVVDAWCQLNSKSTNKGTKLIKKKAAESESKNQTNIQI